MDLATKTVRWSKNFSPTDKEAKHVAALALRESDNESVAVILQNNEVTVGEREYAFLIIINTNHGGHISKKAVKITHSEKEVDRRFITGSQGLFYT